jgi:hypothetical protein
MVLVKVVKDEVREMYLTPEGEELIQNAQVPVYSQR